MVNVDWQKGLKRKIVVIDTNNNHNNHKINNNHNNHNHLGDGNKQGGKNGLRRLGASAKRVRLLL
jgi:hypothetical protein